VTATVTEDWRRVWRTGVAPCLSDAALTALRDGLRDDDERLLQGHTTSPPPLTAVMDWPVEAGCALCYAAWRGDGLTTVEEVEESFGRVCWAAEQTLGEPAAVRHFINWWDKTPRYEAIAALLPEVELALASRREGTPDA
jgi:hypothetical protein